MDVIWITQSGRTEGAGSAAMRTLRNLLITLVAVGIVFLGPSAQLARAGLVPTEAVLASVDETQAAHARIDAFLQRADVADQMQALGVDAHEARSRVAGLTNAEVARIDSRLAELPAGGDFITLVAGILITLILVLLITDLMGYTDVFGFINPLPKQS